MQGIEIFQLYSLDELSFKLESEEIHDKFRGLNSE